MRLRFLSLLLCVLAPFSRATTVVPPEFPELVAEADAIYRGRIASVEARRVARPDGGRSIKTFVTVAIDRVLKGAEETNVTLEFLGGTVGEETLDVGGMPKFTVGEKGILFVQRNGRQFCPLVRLGHGSYRIEKDPASGRDYVARANRAPLIAVDDVQLPLGERTMAATRVDPARALSPESFETRIMSEVRTPTLKARIN